MITSWTDPTTGNTMLLEGSGSSKLAYWEHDYYQNRILHWDQTQVNYGSRTWWNYNERASGPIQGQVPPGPVGGAVMSPAVVKELLAADGKIVGHPVVDGRHTVEIYVSFGKVLAYRIWADSHSYQVVRTVKYFLTIPGATPLRADYTWVPATAKMSNLINHPQIPAGFTRVSADS